MKLTVEVDSLRLFARHGVFEQERRVGNEFEVSASLTYSVPDSRPGEANAPDSPAIDYSRVIALIKERMAETTPLLEDVALGIADAMRAEWPFAQSGRVRVVKLTPPVSAQLKGASVTVEWP